VTAAMADEPLIGDQNPRIMTGPSYDSSPGREAIELAALGGLKLDPWQQLVLDRSLGEINHGRSKRWAAFEVGLIVPRQNGKGSILEARELFGLFLEPRERLILHSAHEFKTASEAFLRVKQCIDSSEWLTRKVKNVRTSHGEEGIELKDGSRLRFVARSTGSGRGFTGDCLILDEAYNLGSAEMAALLPTLSARPNPQVWYTSSAGMITSEQLRAVRIRGRKGDSSRLAYFEWSCPEDCDLEDPRNWAQANPSLGYRIDRDFIQAEWEALTDDVFARERLGIWQEDNVQTVIDLKLWASIGDPESLPGEKICLSIDVKPDASAACIASSGRRADDRLHVKIVDHRPDMGWVVERIAQLVERYKPVAVMLDPSGPAGSLLSDLAELGIEPKLVVAREMAQACGAFHNDVVNDRLRHADQETLTAALRQANTRELGDAWAWSRRDSRGDISPLVAATIAAHGFRLYGGDEPPRPWVVFS
jgi:phage terminase large subunit-like protein